MKVLLSAFIYLITYSDILSGQNISSSKFRHHFGYSFGISQVKEENLIPKVHKGLNHFILYEFEKRDDIFHNFHFYLGYGKMKTEIESEALSFNAQLSAGYCYNFRIFGNETFCYYLGPNLAFTSSLSEYEIWDEAHAYWGNYFSLGPGNIAFIKLKGNKIFVAHLDLAILGFYTRPDYYRLYANEYWTFSNIIKIMNSHYHFGFLNNAFQMKASIEYRTPIFNDDFFSFLFSIYYSQIKANDGKALKELFPKLGVGIWF